MVLPQQAYLAVLLGDQLLTHRGDLYVDVIFGKVEIGPEEPRWFALIVPLEGKGMWLVLPVDTVEIQQPSKFPLAVVSEIGKIGR